MAIALNSNIAGGADPARSRVEATLGADLPIGNANRTVEFWAFTHANSWVGENNTIFEYGSQAAPNGGFGLDFGNTPGTMDPYTNGSFDNEGAPGLANFSMDQWVHFAMTYNGTAVILYVNGATSPRGTRMVPGTMLQTTVTALTIGGNPRGAFFNGYIDEFRVWNVARTAAEITATMHSTLTGTEPGLVGYWKFDETSGTTAADSANGAGHTKHPGTLMATSPALVPTWIPSTAPITNCP